MKKLLIIFALGIIGYLLFAPSLYQQKQAELDSLGVEVDIMQTNPVSSPSPAELVEPAKPANP